MTNPVPATGGDDAEGPDQARRNAPLGILTLDRIVSLQDYEDFARAFAGVAKALTTWTWYGETRGVFITVAGPGGSKIEEGSSTYKHLLDAIRKAGDPYIPVRVASYAPAYFQVEAKVQVDPDQMQDKVLAEVEQALRRQFSFEAREFGQPVTRSEILAVMQNVRGVVAVDLDVLKRSDNQPHLRAALPQPTRTGQMVAAEMLLLDPRPLKLGVMS